MSKGHIEVRVVWVFEIFLPKKACLLLYLAKIETLQCATLNTVIDKNVLLLTFA